MPQVRRDRVAFFPPLGVSALVDGSVQFLAQRLRPIARISLKPREQRPARHAKTVFRNAAQKFIRIATIDIDRDPWWMHFRRRR